MTKILFFSLLLLFMPLSGLMAQEDSEPDFEYIPLEKFAGDTLAFLNHNFYFSPPNFYEGKTIEELLEYANLPHLLIGAYKSSNGKIASVDIEFKSIPLFFPSSSAPVDIIDLEKKTHKIKFNLSPSSGRRNPKFVFLEASLEPNISSNEFYDKKNNRLSYTVRTVRLNYEYSQLTPPTKP